MDPTRVMKLTAFAGLGLMIVGGVLVYRQWTAPLPGTPGAANNPSPLSGRLRGLGRADRHKPMFRGFVDQAPVVSSYSDGNMQTQLRESVDMPIEQRLATIQDLVHKSVQDPEMRKLALQLTANCPARDGMCEAKAIFKAVKDRIRYTGDVAPIQMPDGTVDGIDLYQSARRTWFDMKGGDCDDMSILIATLLSLNGITARLRVMKEDPNEDWTHIYPVAMLPKNAPTSAVALDTTLPGKNKFGVEAPAAQTLDFAA